MKNITQLFLGGGALLLLVGCGSMSVEAVQKEPMSPIILQGQQIGAPVKLGEVAEVKLLAVQYNIPINPLADVPPQTKSFGFLVQICTSERFTDSLDTSKFDFGVSLADDTQGNVLGSEGQKEPQFINKTLLTNDCNSGWITADYPGTTAPTSIRYTYDESPGTDKYIIEWNLPAQ